MLNLLNKWKLNSFIRNLPKATNKNIPIIIIENCNNIFCFAFLISVWLLAWNGMDLFKYNSRFLKNALNKFSKAKGVMCALPSLVYLILILLSEIEIVIFDSQFKGFIFQPWKNENF